MSVRQPPLAVEQSTDGQPVVDDVHARDEEEDRAERVGPAHGLLDPALHAVRNSATASVSSVMTKPMPRP